MEEQQAKKKVLFLCTHNSARSQMAEALLNDFGGGRFEVCSAGTQPTDMNQEAVKVMQEIGIDISHNRSKSVTTYANNTFDYVVSVCDINSEQCPVFPGATNTLKWNFRDPAMAVGSDEQKLTAFRTLRDEISAKITQELLPLLQ